MFTALEELIQLQLILEVYLGPKDYGKTHRQIKICHWSDILWWGRCTTLHPLCVDTGFGPLRSPSQLWDSGSAPLLSAALLVSVSQGVQSERLLAIRTKCGCDGPVCPFHGDTCTLRSHRCRHHSKRLQGGIEISPFVPLCILCWRKRWMAEYITPPTAFSTV